MKGDKVDAKKKKKRRNKLKKLDEDDMELIGENVSIM